MSADRVRSPRGMLCRGFPVYRGVKVTRNSFEKTTWSSLTTTSHPAHGHRFRGRFSMKCPPSYDVRSRAGFHRAVSDKTVHSVVDRGDLPTEDGEHRLDADLDLGRHGLESRLLSAEGSTIGWRPLVNRKTGSAYTDPAGVDADDRCGGIGPDHSLPCQCGLAEGRGPRDRSGSSRVMPGRNPARPRRSPPAGSRDPAVAEAASLRFAAPAR
jgi:hypothetical protein